MPCTRWRTPQMTRAPQITRRSQNTHIQYSGVPRMKIDASTTAVATGTTVTSIHSTNSAERSGQTRARHQRQRALELRIAAACVALPAGGSASSPRSCVHERCPAPAATQLGHLRRRSSARGAAAAHQVRLAAGGLRRLQVAQRVADHRHLRAGRRRSAGRSPAPCRAAACGSRSCPRACAGRRTPRRCARPAPAALCIMCACTAFSAAMSIMPRPMPDWLVATTACQPAWFSRAIASSAPGIGYPFLGRLDVVVAVLVEDAVAVEDDELRDRLHGAVSFRPPAWTGRRRGSSPRAAGASSARRLARRAGSSALTITLSKKASTGAFSAASACSEPV